MSGEELRRELIDEILQAHAGGWLIDAAEAAGTAGEAEAVLRYHLVGSMGGRRGRRWVGERRGVEVDLGGERTVISWRDLAVAARGAVSA